MFMTVGKCKSRNFQMLETSATKYIRNACNFWFYEIYFSVSFSYKCFTYNKKYTIAFPT